MTIKAAKGTRDILPGEVETWQRVEQAAHRVFRIYGFQEIRTPIFEATDLFNKSTGSDTDIVTKEMYTFNDRGDRSMTLRPEGTPGVVRAALEHALVGRSEIERLYYMGPMFRYERPQKGRYRQFSQIGVEVFGSAHAATDAEVMEMVVVLLRDLGIVDASLQINSVGHAGCRPAYRTALREALEPRRAELCPDCQRRLDTNPLRILDCKVPGCAAIVAAAPSIIDFLCEECRDHFSQVRECLVALSVQHEVNPRLVRGLDYYTRTTFEVSSDRLGSQNALCGGGRYDELVASMGGPATPGFGFAIGTDRLVMVVAETAGAGETLPRGDVYVVHLGEAALREGLAAAHSLRAMGFVTRFDPDARDLKKQMSRASAWGARYSLIIGDREIEQGRYALKRMADGIQKDVPARQWDVIGREVAQGDGHAVGA
ncbi:MAG TPA: histidine--tRNA ligase [Patescibacteria group bacterium]|nr:histidine--tRNA ligase [Patescibacteria group bacterium]